MIEDSPPNIPSTPVPDEITGVQQRKTVPPMDVVDAHMVALSLSSMATTLEQIQVAIAETRGVANLAGGIASAAREEIEGVRLSCNRIEAAVGQLALSMQGLEQASRSLIEAVFPERDPDIELAEVVPIRRVMTGE